MNKDTQGKLMGQVIAKAWADEAFKQRLLADATAVLKEEGVPVPDGMEIKAVENTKTVVHLVIPGSPDIARLDEDALSAAAAGRSQCGWVVTPDGSQWVG